jgi:pimeloyl-[acyl-carrier protein] methyl ester esterase
MIRQIFTLDDCRTLALREIGSGPPLVLLHGWSISSLAFVELAGLLSSDFRVLMPDLPGHGDSSPCDKVDLERIAADLLAWLSSAVPERLYLAGWSLGGMVAMEMVRQQRERFAGLVLIGTTPRFTATVDWPHGLPAGEVKMLRRNLSRRFESTLGDFFKMTFVGDAITVERQRAIRQTVVYPGRMPDPDVVVELLDLLGVQDQRQSIADLDLPALVLHGTNDRVTSVAAGAFLADQLPRGQFVPFADTGHAPFWSHPERVAVLLKETRTWFR